MLVRALGLRDYREVWDLQKRLVLDRARGLIPDTLILVEHDPVYTIGRSSKQKVPEGLPYPVHVIERGGDITFHGPGQLVGYPILRLGQWGIGPRSYLRTLEEVLILAVARMGGKAERLKAFTGIWAGGKKLASIGVAVSRKVSFHGFALNVKGDLTPFNRIHPCKLEPSQMITLESLLGRPIEMEEALRTVGETFLEIFPKKTRGKLL